MNAQFLASQGFLGAQITINLEIANHYITQLDVGNNRQLFRRKAFRIIIQPYDQNAPSDETTSFSSSNRPVVYLKTEQFSIFVGSYLKVFNIIFDGIDLPLQLSSDLSNANSDANKKQTLCPTNTACNIKQLNSVRYPLNEQTFGLFTIENVYDMVRDVRLNTPNQIYKDFSQINNKYFPDQNRVLFRNVNLGITAGTAYMRGVRQIILPLLGESILILNSVTFQNCFAPGGLIGDFFQDPAYESNQAYLEELARRNKRFTANSLTIQSYNSEQISTLFTTGNQQQIAIIGTVFFFKDSAYQATITNLVVNSVIYKPTLQGNPVIGSVLQLFLISQGTFVINNMDIQETYNLQLFYIAKQANVLINQGLVNNTLIEQLDAKVSPFINQFQFVTLDSTFKVTNVNFLKNNYNLIYATTQGVSFDGCVFGDTILLPQQVFFYFDADDFNRVFELKNSVIRNLESTRLTTFFFGIKQINTLQLISCTVQLLKNIRFIASPEPAYGMIFTDVLFTDLTEFQMTSEFRASILEWNRVEIRNVQNTISFMINLGATGRSPYQNINNLVLNNIKALNFWQVSTNFMFQNYTNLVVKNVQFQESFYSICCDMILNFINVTVISSKMPIFFKGQSIWFYFTNLNYTQDIDTSLLFADVFFKVQMKFTRSVFIINQGTVQIVSGSQITSLEFENSTIQGKVGKIFTIQNAFAILIQELLVLQNQGTQQNVYLWEASIVQDFRVIKCRVDGLQNQVLSLLNSVSLQLDSSTFTNIRCGTDSCFKIQNQLGTIAITSSQFQNFFAQSYLFDVEYSIQLIFNSNKVSDANLQKSAFYNMQTNVQLTSCEFTNMQSAINIYVLDFIDSGQVSLSNLKIKNQNKSQGKGSIRAILINSLSLNKVSIDTMTTTGDQSAVKLELFQQLAIASLSLSNIRTAYSILAIATSLKNLKLYLKDITCTNNYGNFSSCLNLITESEFYIFKLKAFDNIGNQLYVKSDNQVYVDLCLFELRNNANSKTYSENRIITIEGASVGITGMTIYNVSDDSPAISARDSIVKIKGSQFTKILPFDKSKSLIIMMSFLRSTLSIRASQLITQQESAQSGDATLVNSNQLISMESSEGTFTQLLIQGFNLKVVQTKNSSIQVSQCTFMNNDNSQHFDMIDSSLDIAESYFTVQGTQNFFQLVSNTQKNIFTISNTTISFKESFNFGIISKFLLVQTSFLTVLSANSNLGTGLQLIDILTIKINRTTLNSLRGQNGGCISIVGETVPSNIQIFNSVMDKCTAVYAGGALYIHKNVFGTINELVCQRNIANVGGCIAYNGIKGSSPLLIRSSQFIYNTANVYAGALVSLDSPLQLEGNIFRNNMAPSQIQSGTYGKSFRIVNLNIDYLKTLSNSEKCDYIRDQIIYTPQNSNLTVASGQLFNFVLALVDDSGFVVFNDNFSKAQLETTQGSSTLVINGQATCEQGLFIFSNLIIIQTPGTDFRLVAQLSIVKGSAQVDEAEVHDSVSYSQDLIFYSRFCQKGEILSADNTCSVCQIDTFSLVDPHDPRLASQSCSYCPQNAFCVQEAIFPKKGYWIFQPSSNLVLKCRSVEYCLGKEDLYSQRISSNSTFSSQVLREETSLMYDNQCLFGHQKALCQECIPGYFKFTSTSACIPCQGNKAATMLLILIVFGVLMFYSIYQSEKYMQKSSEGQDIAILIKIFVNYIQTLTLLGNVNLNWTKNIGSILDFGQDFFGTQFNFISLQCLSSEYVSDQEEQFYMNLLLQVSVPFIIFASNSVYFIFQIFINWRYEKNRQKSKLNKDKKLIEQSLKQVNQCNNLFMILEFKSVSIYILVLNAVVCTHLFYSLLTSTPTKLFYCETISTDNFNNEVQYLSNNLNIQCWTEKFNQWFYAFGIMLSVLFGLGIPILLGIYMYIYRIDLKDFDKSQTTSCVLNSKKKSENHTFSKVQTMLVKKSMEPSEIPESVISPCNKQNQYTIQGLGLAKDFMGQHSIQAQRALMHQSEHHETQQRKSKSDLDTQKLSRHQTVKLAQMRKSKWKALVNKVNAARSLGTKKSKIKKSEVFLFLVDPYRSNVFYWEIVVLLRKFTLIIIGLLIGVSDSESNPALKYLLLNIYLLVFFKLNLVYDPYYSNLFNYLENYSFIAIICSCLSGIISSIYKSLISEILADLVFLVANGIYLGLITISFIALSYANQDLEELMSEPHTIWKRISIAILKKHSRRTEGTESLHSSMKKPEYQENNVQNPMD